MPNKALDGRYEPLKSFDQFGTPEKISLRKPRQYILLSAPLRSCYYQSRIKCPLFGGKKLKWSDDNKHPTRPLTILKNKKAKNGERSSVFVFFSMVWGRVGWSIYHHSIWVFQRKGDILFCSGNNSPRIPTLRGSSKLKVSHSRQLSSISLLCARAVYFLLQPQRRRIWNSYDYSHRYYLERH